MKATPITAQTGQVPQGSKEAIAWLVNDARYLARQSRFYREHGHSWLADRLHAASAHRLSEAREYKQGARS